MTEDVQNPYDTSNKLLQIDGWYDYAFLSSASIMSKFFEFITATKEMTDVLDDALNRASSFDELKKEISQLVDNRRKFLAHAENHAP